MKAATKRFHKITDPALKRSVNYAVRFTESEMAKIKNLAKVRLITPAEYIRRSSLDKSMTLHHDEDAISTLRVFSELLRESHKIWEELGIAPPTEMILVMNKDAREAMLKLKQI